jgi:hypothetical protein
LGKLQIVSEDAVESTLTQARFDVCLIDEGAVKNAAQLICYLHEHIVDIQLIAFTNTLSWKKARAII